MKYRVGIEDEKGHFIAIECSFTPTQSVEEIRLPAWRPGRYELGNFVKNIRSFRVMDSNQKPIPFLKTGRESWQIEVPEACNEVIIAYSYFADQLNAGSSYAAEDILYINPVNCLVYLPRCINEASEIQLLIPKEWKIAGQLQFQSQKAQAADFHILADSPIIASEQLQTHSFDFHFQEKTHRMHFHFWGQHSLDISRLEADTLAYTQVQAQLFKAFPCSEYHFLYILPGFPFRHGVEHSDSTVIAMGQGPDELDESFYNDFLAISSHELFHLWNVKRIRPAEMWPYDYTRENFSRLGYVYEGVTTYYGDLMLLGSEVWDLEQYLDSLSGDLAKHLNNPGRMNYSVAESSFDTWIDGYVAGTPGRKVSIYTEGMLAAFIADLMILEGSKCKHSLDDVMRCLYEKTFQQNIGYTEALYQGILEEKSGVLFNEYFEKLIHGKNYFMEELEKRLPRIGLQIVGSRVIFSPNEQFDEKMFTTWKKRLTIF